MKKLILPMVLGLGFLTSAQARSVPGEVVVKIKPGQTQKFLAKKSSLGVQVKKSMKLLSGEFVVLRAKSKSISSLLEELKRSPEVVYAEPNFLYQIQTPRSPDPLFGKLWGLLNTGNNEPGEDGEYTNSGGLLGADINAENAWKITKGSKRIVVAVIDTGIDYTHPDLKENLWVNQKEIKGNNLDDDGNGYVDDVHGWNAAADTGDPMDGHSHGTHCAGTIGARHDNGIGVAGVMGEVSLMAVKFLTDEGSGSLEDAIEAIDYATKMNVDVMSNSWGGASSSQALEDAIKVASERGILFVAAAGNSGTNNDTTPNYPANLRIDNVISVAAHTHGDSLADFSSFGKNTVHVAAPGNNILSTTTGNTYKVYSGTSMATPHVAGVLGLYLSQVGRQDVGALRERLMATTVPSGAYRKSIMSGGRVDAYNFLTNTRLPRQTPEESSWKTENLSQIFETAHPYENDLRLSKTYTFPGAKYVKLVIEKFELEHNYDFLIIKDGRGAVLEKLTGKGADFQTDYAETESITVEFTSDSSEARFGAVIKKVKVIY